MSSEKTAYMGLQPCWLISSSSINFNLNNSSEELLVPSIENMKAIKKKIESVSDQEQVTAHIKKLEPQLGKIIKYLRKVILSTDKAIGERIKWNNPSFYYSGEMKPSDPKEYKREIIVFNLFKGRIMLVFPSGAKVKDTSGLLQGDYKDGRRITIFKDMADIKSKEKALQKIIKEWLKLVDK